MVVRRTDPAPNETPDASDEHPSHDLIFKTVCRNFFEDVVAFTRSDLIDLLDLQDVEFLDKETFSDFPKGRPAIADLVVKAHNKDGEEQLVLIQVEIEADFRSGIDERAFYYYLHLRAKYRLPVAVVVIFLRGGQLPLETRTYIDKVGEKESCTFEYTALSLRRNRAEYFLTRPEPLAPAFAALMPSPWRPAEKKFRCLQAARKNSSSPDRLYELVRVIESYILLDEAEGAHFATLAQDDEEVQKMVITWEDALAHARGEGRDEGKIAAARSHIARILKLRLQDVPAFISERLDAIDDVERLEAILDQAAVVNSVDELALD
jgi:hypothetical protein